MARKAGLLLADLTNVVMDMTAKQRFAAAFFTMTVREQRHSSPHKGATGRVRSGDQRYCQLGQDKVGLAEASSSRSSLLVSSCRAALSGQLPFESWWQNFAIAEIAIHWSFEKLS